MKTSFCIFSLICILASCQVPTKKISQKVLKVQFEELKTGATSSLRGLHVVSGQVVWASGSKGTFLVTKNGGKTWKVGQVPEMEENDFRSIYAWDENKALLFGIGNPAIGLLTEDGGKTWEKVFEKNKEGIFFSSMEFADAQHGIAVSDPVEEKFFIIKTQDGGKNWQVLEQLPKAMEGEANFAASNTCIEYHPSGHIWIATGGATARVFYSTNHGESWDVANTPIVQGNPTSGIFSVVFPDSKNGVITGGTYNAPGLVKDVAAFTTDGGKTWKLPLDMPSGFRSCVQFVGGSKIAIAMGKTGFDYSVDKGHSWVKGEPIGYYTIRAIPGKMSGFAAGSNGRVAKFTIIQDD